VNRLYVIRYGEIALKGGNRNYFEQKLVSNIKAMLGDIDEFTIKKEHGRIFLYFNEYDEEYVEEQIKKVFGIVSFSPARVVGVTMEEMKEAAYAEFMKAKEGRGAVTFKVETRRPNKGFPMKSPEISREVGAHILINTDDVSVDVHKPEILVQLEVRDKVYVYTRRIKGQGGMPYGSAGKGMLLLSGGIDSPVSGYMMARRGIQLQAIHYHSYPFTSERAQEKVVTLARKLAGYVGRIKVFSVNLLEIQKSIAEKCPSEEMTILSRRFMMTIAERVAKENKCKALITGESLGQVASQTIEGLNVTNDAVTLPVFRPLIAMDKVDIMDLAHDIDTYETSILPFEDCCTVFLPDRVVTKPKVPNIRRSEELLDKEGLIERAIENMEVEVITID